MDPRSPPDAVNDDRVPSLQPPTPPSPPRRKARSSPTPPAPKKRKKKTTSVPPAAPTNKKQKRIEKKIVSQKKLAYERTAEEMREVVQKEVIDHFKSKVPEKRVPVDPQIAAKVYAYLNNPPPPKKLPSDYDRTLIKAHQQRNKKCGKTVPQLGTQQKELEPLLVPREPNQHEAEFLLEIGLTLEQVAGRTDDIPVAPFVAVPYKLGKPFVIEEEEISLGTQMYNFHKWYLRMSNDGTNMFGVKYRDQDFFHREDDFWVDFELLHHIYRRQALDVSIITIWVL